MPLLGETVEASREKRLERQQARFRDRGGIFKPSEHNPLLDLLLARGVNGESPSRANSPRRSRSRSASPKRRHQVLPPPPERVKAAPAKKTSRKSEAKRKADFSKQSQEARVAEAEVEEPIQGPSKPTAPKRATKGRSAKSTAKPSRSQSNKSRCNAEEQRNETVDAEEPVPVTSKKPGKASKAKKAPASAQPASKPKRPAKPKAPSPERTQHPDPEAELHHHSDDEPLLKPKPKKSKTTTSAATRPAKRKAPSPEATLDLEPEPAPGPESDNEPLLKPKKPSAASRSNKAASSSKPVVAVDNEHKDELTRAEPVKKRHVKDKEAAGTGAQRILPADDTHKRGEAPELDQAQRTKGKRKAEANEVDLLEEEAPRATASRSNKSKPPKESVRPDLKGAEEEPLQKPRKKRRPADGDADDHPGVASKRQHRSRPILNEPSSPDLPLANVTSKAKPAALKRTSDAALDDENEMPPPPPKKRRPSPEHERVDDAVIPSKEKRKMVIPRPDSPEARITRPKAPPVFAPKGTVLKPKPRPRLSLFPAPSLEEDSEEDPIDLLS